MILSAHQPSFLPWPGYLHRIALCDTFIILDDVQFERNSFTNRNRLKTANGPVWLTVPLEMKGHTESKIHDMQISKARDWRDKQWKTIYFNYKKTPFFSQYEPYLKSIFEKEWNYLHELISEMLSFYSVNRIL